MRNSWDRGGSKGAWGEAVLRSTDTQQVKGMAWVTLHLGSGARAGGECPPVPGKEQGQGRLLGRPHWCRISRAASCARGDRHGKTSVCQ